MVQDRVAYIILRVSVGVVDSRRLILRDGQIANAARGAIQDRRHAKAFEQPNVSGVMFVANKESLAKEAGCRIALGTGLCDQASKDPETALRFGSVEPSAMHLHFLETV